MKKLSKPTFLISQKRLKNNIVGMKDKVENSRVGFRPHFKTHQSKEVGKIYRELGISEITVSSIDMALYFARSGWKDITIAFPVNIRQIEDLNLLAEKINLHLLVESDETVNFLDQHLTSQVNIWIKVDIGYHRTGIPFNDKLAIKDLVVSINKSNNLQFQGLLTHAGHAYTSDFTKKKHIFETAKKELTNLKHYLISEGYQDILLSYGDTPTCSLFDDFSDFDEIRPGNFAFYDLTQLTLNSCKVDQIAVLLACPVVALHPSEKKVIIHGGGVHFSKDFLPNNNGPIFGYLGGINNIRWTDIDTGNYLANLSQDHGELVISNVDLFNQLNVGDMLYFYPVHSCMTANLMKNDTILLSDE